MKQSILIGTLLLLGCGGPPCDPGYLHTTDHHCVLIVDAGVDASAADAAVIGPGSITNGVQTAPDAGAREAGAGGKTTGTMDAADASANAAPAANAQPASAGRGGAAGERGSEPPSAAAAGVGGSAGAAAPRCGDGHFDSGEACDGNCPAECLATSACTTMQLTGSADHCDVECSAAVISICTSGDGCCPAGCTHATDADCSASCGDGVVDPGEKCERNSSSTPCPTSCDDADHCTTDMLLGSADQCSAECVHTPITAAHGGDSCCPPNANATTDSDCKPICGNSAVEPGEVCDGNCPTACPAGSGCATNVLMGSAASCNAICAPMIITAALSGDGCCPSGADSTTDADCKAVCGNSVIESGEKCDGNCPSSCPGGSGCSRMQLSGSACGAECVPTEITAAASGDGCCPANATANTDSDCKAVCGNGAIEGGETCDLNCPTSCRAGSGCDREKLVGSADECNAACVPNKITMVANGDSCCPNGATGNDDSDCDPICGNAETEPGEECDIGGLDPDGRPYDKWSCDSRCKRLYDFTPCSDSSECGGSICERGKCVSPCSNTQSPHSCFTSSGVAGYCYAYCFPDCSGQSDCPTGTTCNAFGEPVGSQHCNY
jgi:hypothetical protein